MPSHRLVVPAILATLGLALAGAALPAGAAPPGQAAACRWDRLGATLTQALYFSGAAWDPTAQAWYLNGGLDATDTTKRLVQAGDFSNPDLAQARFRNVTTSGGAVQDYWATAGAFRVAPPGLEGAQAVFWGGGEGGGRASAGEGQKIAQTYVPKTNTWTTQTAGANGVTLAAAAADPARDLVVWVGGVKVCDFFDITPADPLDCSDTQNQTTFVTFDAATGAMKLQAGPVSGGPGRVLGGSLVHDAAGGRLLYFGGTDNAESGRARNTVFQLDLSDSDLTKARWSQLGTSGQAPPARAFHGAAFHADRRWMVVYGGVGQGFFSGNENALTDTWALDLGQTPPRWTNLGLNTPGERVGAVAAYDGNHQAVLLAGGRRSFNPGGQQNVSRDVYALTCSAGGDPTVTPTFPGPTLPPPSTVSPTPGLTPVPTQPPAQGASACPQLAGWRIVPDAVIADALANPTRYYGWQQPNNPAVPPGPYNPLRVFLSLAAPGKPYHPIYNGVIWKAGCP
jgi:hypothetical protein